MSNFLFQGAISVIMTIKEIKKRHSLAEVANKLGLKVKRSSGTEAIKCPNPAHDDKTPSCVFMHDINMFECKSCGVKGDIIELFQLVTGCTKKEAIDSIEPNSYKEKFIAPKVITPEEYIKQRKITPETIKKFDIRVLLDKIVYPIPTGYKKRLFGQEDKWKTTEGTKECLFKTKEASAEVILCEGEIDAIKLWQETGLSIWTSTAGAGSFDEKFIPEFSHLKKIYIAYDNDEAGKKGAEKVADLLGRERCYFIKIPEYAGKDINDYFLWGHTADDFLNLMAEAEWGKEKLAIIDWEYLSRIKFPKDEWYINKFIPKTGFTLLVGESNSGKSFLTLFMAKCIKEDSKFLDKYKTSPAKILFIDKENGLRRIQKRLNGLNCSPTKDILFLKYPEKFSLDDKEFVQYLTDYIEENNINIIVCDSLIDFLLGEENSSGDTSKLFNTLRNISTSVVWLIVHHSNKPVPMMKSTASHRTRGSSNIMAQVDYQFYIEKDPDNQSLFVLSQGKARDAELMKQTEIEFVVKNEEVTSIRFKREIESEVKQLEQAQETVNEFIKMQTEPLSRAEIALMPDCAEIGKRMLSEVLRILEEKRIVGSRKITGKGNTKHYYSLLKNDEKTPEENPNKHPNKTRRSNGH